ncbi:hypothetical protein ACF0H5_023325 [Mactra antiquata]
MYYGLLPWFLGLLRFTTSVFSPNVTVTGCESREVTVDILNASDGGIIFIQERNESCRYVTESMRKSYKFHFDTCNIEYNEQFRVIVQKHPNYQTGYDKVIPVICMIDTSDLIVSSIVYPEEPMDNSKGLNKTTKPKVRMKISTGNGLLTAVNVNDKVNLSLILEDKYNGDFDIKAKNCRAEMISLVKDECSTNENLFPNFDKIDQGSLQAMFEAFRPTNFDTDEDDDDNDVDVIFTCNIAVCKGKCHQKFCGEIAGFGRQKRSDDDDVIEDVTCATKLRVKATKKSTNFIDGVSAKLQGKLCAEKVTVASVLAVTTFTLIVSWIVCACVTSKLRRVLRSSDEPRKPSTLRRLSEKNINFARSVGRRLSTMLNLPVGYKVQDRRMMGDFIPEGETTPPAKRRDSVTVRKNPGNIHSSNVTEPFCQEYTSVAESPCTVRKRFVDSSVQTEGFLETTSTLKPISPKIAPAAKNPFAFITSISIKSGVTKPKKENQSDYVSQCDYEETNDVTISTKNKHPDVNATIGKNECSKIKTPQRSPRPQTLGHRNLTLEDNSLPPRSQNSGHQKFTFEDGSSPKVISPPPHTTENTQVKVEDAPFYNYSEHNEVTLSKNDWDFEQHSTNNFETHEAPIDDSNYEGIEYCSKFNLACRSSTRV